ncbi:hypothetical protein MSUIS_00470 [Mycoplasma suis KI3806]|uniref:Uncharacterized protein n=1 Tax=Mycoplasma suis (strain KI_3806) TaxID=708248 RepID=F0V2R8_MYCS3|nr:hypothetical protein [Mycoplasma suis]CBZ40140.1 hypothetical protein MSUIS_00470 [Mycoplasma suis KI3806]
MVKAVKVLLPLLGIGTVSGGGFAVYSFSDSFLTFGQKVREISQATTLDSENLKDLTERIKKGQSTLIYELLKKDGTDKECIKRIKGEEDKSQDFQDKDCVGWDLSKLGENLENKKIIWVKLVDSNQTNSVLGQWFETDGNEGFQQNKDSENKQLKAKESGDEIITFSCNKSPISSEGNLAVEVKCILELQNSKIE